VLSLPNGVVLRLSNMIGPRYAYRPAGAKFMQWLHESYVRRDAVALRHDEVRSFVHLDDVVEVLCRAVRRAALHTLLSPTAAPAPLFGGYRVFNVGGSMGLSRLGLGTLLAEASGATLAVADTSTSSPSAADPTVWAVKSSSNAESIVATGIHNPRDVTMDSAATERTFGFKFTPTRTAVTQIVRGFEAAASSM
jgi:nucleoside-diphosphate-sugar epimerase